MTERKCATCGRDESLHGHMFGASTLLHGFLPEPEARCRCGRLLVCDACTRKAPTPLCAICGQDHDSALQRLKAHSDGLAATSEALLADLRIRAEAAEEQRDHEFEMSESFRVRAEAAEVDAALAWRRVTELQTLSTRQVEENRSLRSGIAVTAKVLRGWLDVRSAGLPAPGDNALRALAERLEVIP